MAVVIGEAGPLGVDPAAIRAFYAAHWKRRVALTRPDFYAWQCQGAPDDRAVDHSVVALERDTGMILGAMVLNRRRFYLHGQPLAGAELTTWTVDLDLLGRGLGARILRHIEARHEVLIGSGVSPMSL